METWTGKRGCVAGDQFLYGIKKRLRESVGEESLYGIGKAVGECR